MTFVYKALVFTLLKAGLLNGLQCSCSFGEKSRERRAGGEMQGGKCREGSAGREVQGENSNWQLHRLFVEFVVLAKNSAKMLYFKCFTS